MRHFSVAKSLSSMMDIILFFITLTCTVVIAFNLYVLEICDSIDLEILVALMDVWFIVAMTFGYFYLSEWITADLLAVGDTFYDSPWYWLPAKQQRILTLPIQRAQRAFRLKGLGLFDCSLVFFLTVDAIEMSEFRIGNFGYTGIVNRCLNVLFQILRTAASYFIMIRNMR